MDSSGRLHMPGFVGQTYEETGVLGNEKAENDAGQMNRKQRRIADALDRKIANALKSPAKAE